MKTVMALSLVAVAVCALACNKKTNRDRDAVDQTRTTSAVVVEPTLHDGHAAEPNRSNVDQEFNQDMDMDMDVDQDMSGVTRDAGATPSY